MNRPNMKPSAKHERQTAIREILVRGAGSTHQEILTFLDERGIRASQATLSRDLREMGVVKAPMADGTARYRLDLPVGGFARTAAGYRVTVEAVGNLLVIKTSSGRAPGFCVILDAQGWDEIAGTIAGDDTIIAVLRNAGDAERVIHRIEQLGQRSGQVIV